MTFQNLSLLARRLLVRAVTSDFQRQRAADEERAELTATEHPVTHALAQDYAAWRRAVLWVAGVMLSIGVLIALLNHQSAAEDIAEGAANGRELTEFERANNLAQVEQTFGRGNLELLDGLLGFLLFVKVAVAVFAIMAALQWT
ncbi:MAG TPA: hypothetical protein ENI87_09385, partial [bacterium]|nr:hypothetical protein [bacterium]